MRLNIFHDTLKDKILKNKGFFISLALGLFFICSIFYFHGKISSMSNDPKIFAKEDRAELVKKISRHMVLPANEEPTVAIINDPEQLKDQPFFANAKKGDRILIYSIAKRAILYDPEIDRILDITPLDLGESTPNAKSE